VQNYYPHKEQVVDDIRSYNSSFWLSLTMSKQEIKARKIIYVDFFSIPSTMCSLGGGGVK
jgi:hypothetical protein